MRTIQWTDGIDPASVCQELAEALHQGGLVCLPCGGRYRIVADFANPDAVIALMQSKSRVHKKPALVFIHDERVLKQVAGELDPKALALARAHWPGPLTIRVQPHADIPGKILKQLGGKKSRIGVRIPADPLLNSLVSAVGRPLLVSSANREKKSGESSPAQVRKTFAARVDVFVDRGDLKPEPTSTVIDVKEGEIVVERPGVISKEVLEGAG